MGKFIIKTSLFLVVLSSNAAMSATGVSCAGAGVCNYTPQGGSSVPGNISRGAPPSPGPSILASRQRNPLIDPCVLVKGGVDREYATCNYDAALDNSREIARCSALNNSSWSWGGSAGYAVIFFNATYTIEKPNYAKCINQVGAAFTLASKYCDLKYVENKNFGRTTMGGRCAGSFQ